MPVNIIDCYHCIPLSVILIWAESHKVSRKQNLLASFSHILFNWLRWNLMLCWSRSNIVILHLNEIYVCNQGKYHCFIVSKNVGMHLDVYKLNWFKPDINDRHCWDTTERYILILVWMTLTLIQGCRYATKRRSLRRLPHKVANEFEWSLVCCWDLFIWWISYPFYLVWSVVKEGNPTQVVP